MEDSVSTDPIELGHLAGPAVAAQVDLLAFATFGDPLQDPMFRAVNASLGGDLAEIARAESFEGKALQTVSVHTHGRLPAKRILVIGAGPRAEFTNPHIRDLVAVAAQAANKSGTSTVGFVMPALGASRDARLSGISTMFRVCRIASSNIARKPISSFKS